MTNLIFKSRRCASKNYFSSNLTNSIKSSNNNINTSNFALINNKNNNGNEISFD